MTRTLAATLFSALSLAATTAAPLAAQEAAGEQSDNVQMSVVYGNDAAPACPAGVICVTAVLPEEDRYRIPEDLRTSESGDNVSWVKRAQRLEFVGNFGTLSCSPTGAGGFTGCTNALIDAAYGEKRESSAIRFAQLIDQARKERLSTIDADAAAEQARVEAIENEYNARLEKEREAELPGDKGPDAQDLPKPPQ